MRVTTETRQIDVEPGSTTSVVLDVVNTAEIIDGVTASVIGLAPELARTEPALLPLFPAASGRLTTKLTIPATHPAGRHPVSIELVSHGAKAPPQYVDVDVDVAARAHLRLLASPRLVRARRSARFVLELLNDGNVALDVALRAADVERSTTATFSPPTVRCEPGTVTPVLLHVRGPRMLTGGEVDRAVTVQTDVEAADRHLDPGLPLPIGGEREVGVRLHQRPLVGRGVLTALILMCIVGVWAAVFLLGLTKVFSGDPMTKAAPASFFAATKNGGAQALSAFNADDPGAAPAGALPKTGQLPPGMGGEITGAVTSAADHSPVGRILVQALRVTPRGLQPVSSAATQSDGTYTLAGLFPMSYHLKFSAQGYHTVWFGTAGAAGPGHAVGVSAQGSATGIDVRIGGDPASISGSVDHGDTLDNVRTTVTARPLLVSSSVAPARSATTGADGSYKLTGLAAPASYQLTFTTPGYQSSTVVDTVTGGDERLEPTVVLGANGGQISGIVTSSGGPVGGATVSTTVGDKPLSVITPTTGQVGAFVLPNLPTPGTYVLTVSAPGHGSRTEIIDLSAGQSRAGLVETLTGGRGILTGRLLDQHGKGLGGAKVSVGGAAASASGTAPSTTTLTSAPVGTFILNGLADGHYTITFALDGYAPASVPVTLDSSKPPQQLTAHLSDRLGGITGTVTTSAGRPYVGAIVTATDGSRSWTATSSAAGSGLDDGGFLIDALPPGTYSVTVTAPGLEQQTRMVRVRAGSTVPKCDLRLGG
jgi:Carboxypeptidase regulatory-like domain